MARIPGGFGNVSRSGGFQPGRGVVDPRLPQALMGGAPIGAQANRPRPAQEAPMTAPGFNEQNFNFGGLAAGGLGGLAGLVGSAAWGNQPQQSSPYLGAADLYSRVGLADADVGMAGLPYGLAAAMAQPTAQMATAGTQGVTAQNLQQMRGELDMNRLQQLLAFAGPLMNQGPQGIQATGAGGYSAGVGPQARVPKTVAMYQQGGSRV